MTPDTLFLLSSGIAAIGWATLILISPFWPGFDKFLVGIIIALLALVYTGLNFANFHVSDAAKFGSLDGVAALFQNKALLTAGWVHFLAFDLLTAVWIKKNAVKLGIPHAWILPALVFSCLLGPLGFLLYLLTRWIRTRAWFAKNF
jgi:ABA4-like protein